MSTTPSLPFPRRQELVELGADLGSRGLLENSPTYYERFREAFVTEVNEFVACCLDDTGQSPLTPSVTRPPPILGWSWITQELTLPSSYITSVLVSSRYSCPGLARRRRPGGQGRRCLDSRVQDWETGLVRRGWGGDLRVIHTYQEEVSRLGGNDRRNIQKSAFRRPAKDSN